MLRPLIEFERKDGEECDATICPIRPDQNGKIRVAFTYHQNPTIDETPSGDAMVLAMRDSKTGLDIHADIQKLIVDPNSKVTCPRCKHPVCKKGGMKTVHFVEESTTTMKDINDWLSDI